MMPESSFSDVVSFFRAEPFDLGKPLLDKLLFSGLDGKIRLGERNRGLCRVAVLGNQIAGIAGEHVSPTSRSAPFPRGTIFVVSRK